MFLTVTQKLLEGFGVSCVIFIVTLVAALPLGLVIAFGSMSKFKPLKWLTKTFVWIIRGTPLMLQILIVFYGPGMVLGTKAMPRMTAVLITFIINYAAYFSEIYRGGIESIPKGQYEAGKVLGLKNGQIFKNIVLLQVIKNIVPPIGNEIITLVKDTSLAQTISVYELTFIANMIRKSTSGGLVPLLAAGLFYYLFNALVAFILSKIEKKLEYIKV